MATVALADVDLFFRAKIEAMLTAGGHRLAAAGEPADVIIADVNRCDPAQVVAAAGAVPVLGFGRHTDARSCAPRAGRGSPGSSRGRCWPSRPG